LANSTQIQIHVTDEIVTMMQHLSNGWEKILTARVAQADDYSSLSPTFYKFSTDPGELQTWKKRCPYNVAVQDFYLALNRLGLSYGTALQNIHELWIGSNAALSHLRLDTSIVGTFPDHGLHPALIEGALQTAGAALGLSLDAPYSPKSLTLFETLNSATEVWAYATVTKCDDSVDADILIVDEWGNACARIGGLKLQKRTLDAVASAPVTSNLRENLKRTSSEPERHQLLVNHVMDCVRLSMKQDKNWTVTEDQPLHEIGLDSLMGITLRNLLSVSFDQELHSTFTFDHPTVASITRYFETMLWATEPATQHESDLTRDEISI
jgi:acyl transferase domain-containing protein